MINNKLEVILDGFALGNLECVELYYDDYMLGSLSIHGSEKDNWIQSLINHYIKPQNELDIVILTKIEKHEGSDIVISAEKHFEATIRFDKQFNTKFTLEHDITTFSFVVIEKR